MTGQGWEVEAAPAKVNLRLEVLGREEGTGYHFIETVFQSLELADRIELRLRSDEEIVIETLGEFSEGIGRPENNLVVLAARRLRGQVAKLTGEVPPGVEIRLTKNVPAEAGLGGGSSDAAATLRTLSRLLGSPLSSASLLEIGAALGSDVPFFLAGGVRAMGWGRGDRLLPLPGLPVRDVLVAIPAAGVSTALAYGFLSSDREASGRTRAGPRVVGTADSAGDWSAVAQAAHNDFEAVLFPRRPELEAVKSRLIETGASPALLSGTGSAVFGVFEDAATADRAEVELRAWLREGRVFRTRTRG